MLLSKVFLPLIAVFAIVGLVIGIVPQVAATTQQSTVNGNGFKIWPVRIDAVIAPGESRTEDVYIQNVSSVAENLQVLVNDFQAGTDESGIPSLLLNGSNAPQNGLRQYVTLPVNNFTIQPQETKDVKVQISIPNNAPGGGYFGAIRFAPVNVDASKNVTLSASVASLVLVKVPGNITEQMSIASFDARSNDKPHGIFISNKSIDAVVRFRNSGNVQEQPFGKIILKKGSTVLASYEVNNTDPPGNVLPNSIRKFTVPLSKIGSFGKYTLEGNFGYGANGQLLSAKTTFYVIPMALMILGLAIVVLILLAVFVMPSWIRAYNRRVLRNASRDGHKK